MPVRIQRKRTKGWKMPPNTVYVGRPTKWGNPFKIGEVTHVLHRSGAWPYEIYADSFHVVNADHAVRLFKHAMKAHPDWRHERWESGDPSELRGKDLACWCPLDLPCHADVLLEIANAPIKTTEEAKL